MDNEIEPDWHKVVNEIGPKLYRYFCGVFPNNMASDLVQETLIRLVQKYKSGHINSQKGNLTSYAYGIAKYVRLEEFKKTSNFDLVNDEQELDVVDSSGVDLINQITHLRWAISQLKIVEQDILLLMIDSEISIEEIAQELDLPEGTVKSHIHRAKIKLRELMEDKNEK